MRNDQFKIHAEVEDDHWWFQSRREILIDQINKFQPDAKRVAEIGCGTGGNLRALSQKGFEVIGSDINPLATKLARERVTGEIYTGDYKETFKKYWDKIDVVILADVLEHIKDDRQFIQDLVENMCQGSILIITVPANPLLWSEHDLILGHFRRYTAGQLGVLLGGLGDMECKFQSYFNCLLFPLIFLLRMMNRLLPRKKNIGQSDLGRLHPLVNALLRTIFSLERLWLGKKRTFPLGVSLLATLQKN